MEAAHLPIHLDFRLGIPIYIQIIDQIQQLVARGKLQPNDQLPTVRQLADDLQVNFNTIARAYRMLDEAGIISTQHGRGTYVLAPLSTEITGKTRRQMLERLTQNYLVSAASLECSAADIEAVLLEKLSEWKEEGSFSTVGGDCGR